MLFYFFSELNLFNKMNIYYTQYFHFSNNKIFGGYDKLVMIYDT